MTDLEWLEGMKQLVVAFPDRDLPEAVLESRGETYRRHLDDLEPGRWRYAVAESIRKERWFPSIACLRQYADDYVPPVKLLAAPACDVCRGTGWEHFDKDGYAFVRPCFLCRPVPAEVMA